MNMRRLGVGVSALTIGYLALVAFFWIILDSNGSGNKVVTGKGKTENVQKAYQRWVAEYEKSPRPGPAIGLVWNKSLSTEFTKAKGIAEIDLENGAVRVNIEGLDNPQISEVWLVENLEGPGRTVRPEPGDQLIHVGSLKFSEDTAWLDKKIDSTQLNGIEVNWVVVARQNTNPSLGGILYGSTSLFQRIYHYADHMPQTSSKPDADKAGSTLFLADAHANSIAPPSIPDASLINRGREIFFDETFEGNGRTCGTCHPADNNFTIGPKFTATLPDDDPLFIAERPEPNPLSENFEKPELMREVGLILENTNGFDDLENDFTMRSVPHILAMRTSLSPPTAAANDGTTVPPDERTGWGGDGSPVDLTISPQLRGTLRDFAVGAVTQHFPKTLNRTPGDDFRLPTETELDALEAFILSLGRQEEFDDFTQIQLTDARAERGRLNYLGAGLANGVPCNACHFNGGANTDPDFDFPDSITPPAFEMTNRSFAPRVEELLDQPGDVVGASDNPPDDGFGIGTNLFNVPTVIEAADTGPFFHGNQIDTVEGLISFYTSQRNLRNGEVLPPIVGLNGSQVANVGAFLRVLNADENARSAIDLLGKASLLSKTDGQSNLQLARAEIVDALEVLEGGNVHFDDAVPLFEEALWWSKWWFPKSAAIARLEEARSLMIQRQ